MVVSIHARHRCRANRDAANLGYLPACFNPRPASLPGESRSTKPARSGSSFQSTPGIAAGRIWSSLTPSSAAWRFNPRPASLPGESAAGDDLVADGHLFHSTPGIAAGRIQLLERRGLGVQRFNPRPASLPGESHGRITWLAQRLVSIHARHRCRANLLTANRSAPDWLFQSTPGIAAGRISA